MKVNMPIKEYHQHEAISKSRLDHIDECILKFLNPPEYKSKALTMGSAVHDAILLPELFESKYIVKPKEIKVRRGKAWDAFVLENDGMEILTQQEYDDACSIRDNIQKHEAARNMVKHGEPEMSYFSKFERFGHTFDVKCRPDLISLGSIVDIKTARSAAPHRFKNSMKDYRYNVQAAWYMDVLNSLYPEKYSDFVFIVIETTKPFAIGVYNLPQNAIDTGRKEYEDNLKYLLEYKENPYAVSGYTDGGVMSLDMPDYYYHRLLHGEK